MATGNQNTLDAAAVSCNDPSKEWTHFSYDTSTKEVVCLKIREYENISIAIPSDHIVSDVSTANVYYFDGCKPCSTPSKDYNQDYVYYKRSSPKVCLEEEHTVKEIEHCKTAFKILGHTEANFSCGNGLLCRCYNFMCHTNKL